MNPPNEFRRWWTEALALEQSNRLDEAERLIARSMSPGAPWECQMAELYKQRAIRLHGQGDDTGALKAAERSNQMMRIYASGATSGSEGLMFSGQADRAEAELRDLLARPRGS